MLVSLVNSVPIRLNEIIVACLAFTRRIAASLRAMPHAKAKATRAPCSPLPVIAPTQHLAVQMSAETHWARVSAVVERSVQQAKGIGEQQAAARQQLDAAEYTLHRLIEELNEVMMSPVQLPKRAELAAPVQDQGFVQAMAA
jgi:hypothetical protein